MDWKWTVTAVLPVVTLALGVLLNQWTDARKERAALERERSLRRLDREQSLLDRREAFELTHLQEVHEVLSEMYTAALRCREVVEADEQPGDATSAALRDANRRFTSIKGLILDESIRNCSKRAHEEINLMSQGAPIDWLQDLSVELTTRHLDTAQEAIAARLRDIYGSHPLQHTRGPQLR